ncbi:MAG TPA: hypothetical protein VMW73_06155 [Spirochaetia bacterium]|nr:hypothetical protein [Spirochaetia bacterium]
MIQRTSEPRTLGSPAYHTLLVFGVLMTWGLGLVPRSQTSGHLSAETESRPRWWPASERSDLCWPVTS